MTGKQDLFEVVDFVTAVMNFLGSILEDGKVTWTELLGHIGEILALPGLATQAWEGKETITWSQISDQGDRDELIAYFRSKLTLPGSESLTEEKIEEGFDAAMGVIRFIFVLGKK